LRCLRWKRRILISFSSLWHAPAAHSLPTQPPLEYLCLESATAAANPYYSSKNNKIKNKMQQGEYKLKHNRRFHQNQSSTSWWMLIAWYDRALLIPLLENSAALQY
jgi:hypothetical protein